MRTKLTSAALLTLAWPTSLALGQQDAPKISVDTFRSGRSMSEAIVRIVNDTGRNFEAVHLTCAFFHQGKAVNTGGTAAHNVRAGETVFETVVVPTVPADAASCRVVSTRP